MNTCGYNNHKTPSKPQLTTAEIELAKKIANEITLLTIKHEKTFIQRCF